MATRAAKPCIPRRIFVTDNKGSRVPAKELGKVLPYVDVDSGTKNRLVDRDPISGLGDLPKEHDPLNLSNRSKIPRPVHRTSFEDSRDPILGKGDLGSEFSCMYDTKSVKPKEKSERDPIALRGDLGAERDIFYPENNRPKRVRDVKEARRNPIAGTGDHGREWDVIYGYDGRPRRSKSAGPELRAKLEGFRYSYKYLDDYLASKTHGNPITGDHVVSYDIMSDDVARSTQRRSRRDMFEKRNPVTGENCKDQLYSREMSHRRKREQSLHNPLTGDECDSFTVHVELERRRTSPSTPTRRSNPLTGQNCISYTYLQESRERKQGDFIYTNPLTGCNRDTYFIIDFENKINQRPFRGGSNPLTGSGCTTYIVSNEEKVRHNREKDLGNPVTGEGCAHYVLTTDERKVSGMKAAAQNNPITGEKCDSYEINMDMRSSKKIMANGNTKSERLTNGQVTPNDCSSPRRTTTGKYNPLTGEAY